MIRWLETTPPLSVKLLEGVSLYDCSHQMQLCASFFHRASGVGSIPMIDYDDDD